MKVFHSALLTIAALSAGFAAQGSADEAGPVRSIVVKYGDLDLAAADGASTLYQRLKHAAREVCKKPGGAFGDPGVFLHCYHNALVHAVRDLGNARVTDQYNEEHKEKLPPTIATAKVIK